MMAIYSVARSTRPSDSETLSFARGRSSSIGTDKRPRSCTAFLTISRSSIKSIVLEIITAGIRLRSRAEFIAGDALPALGALLRELFFEAGVLDGAALLRLLPEALGLPAVALIAQDHAEIEPRHVRPEIAGAGDVDPLARVHVVV